MQILKRDDEIFNEFTSSVEEIVSDLSSLATKSDINELNKFIANSKHKTDDFYRENRKLNIGIVGQVKAGKSSFLNTLLFNGEEILPKASTPKTATLTKMEYSDENIMQIEYYTPEDWEVITDNACIDSDDEINTSSRELVDMAKNSGLDPYKYLDKGTDTKKFDTYDELIANLNDYVGEDGKFTPIVKSVTLYLNKEEFKGLSIVDTPGLNDPIVSRTIRTKEFMEVCDVVFFLSQSSSFLDKSDWTLLSTQLPQKGVKKLVLVASKFDSAIRDVLRVQDEDDVWGDDDNTTDSIPEACKLIKRKLKKRAKTQIGRFVEDARRREFSSELIEIISNCQNPIMVSSLVYNMVGKSEAELTREENNVYKALNKFSTDIVNDLNLVGNFDEVKALFNEVAVEKEQILEAKAKSFIPTAKTELRDLLTTFLEKSTKRAQLLEGNDKKQLEEQRRAIDKQMNGIKADMATVFGEVAAAIEKEKAIGIRELREISKDNLSVKERTGSRESVHSYTTGHLWWKETHYETTTHTYTYVVAADAAENIKRFSLEACNQVEKVFTESISTKEIKRKLLNVVTQNFDMGNEKYDASLFRIMMEEAVSKIAFPVFRMNTDDEAHNIVAKFSGEITSTSEKSQLSMALQRAIDRVYDSICSKLETTAIQFKEDMACIGKTLEDTLLTNIQDEFDLIIQQCNDKENEIAKYKEYSAALQERMNHI